MADFLLLSFEHGFDKHRKISSMRWLPQERISEGQIQRTFLARQGPGRQPLLLPQILLTPRHVVICGVRTGEEIKEASANLELLQKAGLLRFRMTSSITLAKEERRDVGKGTRTLTDDNSDGYVFNSLLARLGLLIREVSARTGEVAATACAPSLDPHGKVETSVPWLPSPISVTVPSFRVF